MASKQNLAIKLLIDAEDRASKVLASLGGRVTALGAAIATYFSGRALAGYFDSAIDSAADLQQQLAILQQTSGASAAEMDQLKAAAEAVADSPLPYTAAQAAAGQIELARAGQTAAQVIASLPPVLNLAAAAQLEVGASAGIVTANLGAFGLEAEESARVADVLVSTANASNTSVQGLADALAYAGPMAKAAGYSIEQAAAAIGIMANAGIDGSRAGTALNSILSQLQDPASKASAALSGMGVSSRDLFTVLDALASGTPAAEKAILAFGTEAGPGLRALVAAGGQGVDGLRTKIAGLGGEAQRAANALQNNLSGAFQELGSLWESIKTKVGESLLGPLEREIRSVSASLRTWVQSGQLDQFRASIVSAFESAVAAAKQFVGAFDLAGATQNLADFAARVGEAMDGARGKIEAIGEVSARVVAAISALWNGFRATVEGVGAAVAGLVAAVLEAWATSTEALDRIGLKQGDVALQARAAADSAKEAVSSYATAAREHYRAAGTAFQRMVGEQEAGVATLADTAQAATAAAAQQGAAVGLTADALDALGASASYAAAGQTALAQATGAGTAAAVADAAAKTQAATAEQTDAAAKAESARQSQAEANARRSAIEVAEQEIDARARSASLIETEGDLRLTHLRNLQAEAQARGDAAEVARLADRIVADGIAVAQANAAAKREEAEAARALADALAAQADAEEDTSAETRANVLAAKQAAAAKHLQAAAAEEAVRHERALANAANAVADATARAADEARRDADARKSAADEEERIREANRQAGAAAWGAYWSAEGMADEFSRRAEGSAQSREKQLADFLFRITSSSSSFGSTAYSAKAGDFIAKKTAEVEKIWAARDAQTGQSAVAAPSKTVHIELKLAGKTVPLDVNAGQETALLEALRKAQMAA